MQTMRMSSTSPGFSDCSAPSSSTLPTRSRRPTFPVHPSSRPRQSQWQCISPSSRPAHRCACSRDRIQEYHCIDHLQRSVLPVPHKGQYLVRYPADRAVRDLQTVDVPDVRLDVPGSHALCVHRQDLVLHVLVTLVWFFLISCGSNSPFRSRGVSISISP